MNPKKNGLTQADWANQFRVRHTGNTQPNKPGLVQLKAASILQIRKQPVAPPVYRPQQVPKVLQTKTSLTKSPHASQAPRKPVAPPVYRPEAKKIVQPKAISQLRVSPTAPPVYRPGQKTIAQPKMASASSLHKLPTAPAVYRPKPRLVGVQPKMPGSSTLKGPPTAPSPYRPQQAPRVLQTKLSSAPPSLKKANAIQRSMDALFGDEEEDDGILGLVFENFAKNEEEKEEGDLEPLCGDPDLVKIYRAEIQTNPKYKEMEKEIRKSPLTISWVPDSVFGSSPARAQYVPAKHEIQVGQSLKGDTDKIVSAISFELLNANSKQVFSAIFAEHETDTRRGPQGYTGIPLYNTNDKRKPQEQLAFAKQIVGKEREEYANVIRREKAAQAVEQHSEYFEMLKGGVHAHWSSFAKYLEDMCYNGHYILQDPDVKNPNWKGWLFVTEQDKVTKDPLG